MLVSPSLGVNTDQVFQVEAASEGSYGYNQRAKRQATKEEFREDWEHTIRTATSTSPLNIRIMSTSCLLLVKTVLIVGLGKPQATKRSFSLVVTYTYIRPS